MKKLFALAVSLCLLAVMLAAPALADYTPGTYTATAQGNNGDVTVEVTFDADAITGVAVTAHAETPGLSDGAIEQIPAAIVAQQSLAVDTVSGATNTSKAILAAVADAVVQAGGSPDALMTAAEKVEIVRTQAEESSDVLVIGGGIAGLTSALSAAENGASVILIDKMPALGGTTALAGGYLIAVGSELYADEKLDFDNIDSMMAYWDMRQSYSGAQSGYPDEARVRSVLAETGATVDWLGGNGIPWGEQCFVYFGGYPAAACDGLGANLVVKLREAVEAKGVRVMTGCKAERLLTENGAVIGAVAQTADSEITFHADSVVLATGGISQNQELVAKYSPKIAAAQVIPTSAVSNTGDGLLMALEVGAGTFEEFGTAINNILIDPALTALADTSAIVVANGLGVDMTGARFANESGYLGFGEYDHLASDMIQNGNAPFWFIYDASNADAAAALEAGAGSVSVKAESAAELAAGIGVDAATLEATIEAYNAAVQAGKDEAFGKPAEYLTAVAQAPFYAVKVYPTTFGSTGGVTTTEQGRVTTQDGTVIEGLYACGEMSNRYFYNENYVLAASLGLYATMGHRTGAAAAADALAK